MAHWRFVLDGQDYFVSGDGTTWSYSMRQPSAAPSVTVTAGTEAFARFALKGIREGVAIEGSPAAVEQFDRLIGSMAASVGKA